MSITYIRVYVCSCAYVCVYAQVVELEVPSSTRPGAGPATVTANLSAEPVTLNIEEKLSVQLNKQGGLENLEVQGTLSLVVQNEDDAYLRVQVAGGANKAFAFKTHPNIDKAAYNSQVSAAYYFATHTNTHPHIHTHLGERALCALGRTRLDAQIKQAAREVEFRGPD